MMGLLYINRAGGLYGGIFCLRLRLGLCKDRAQLISSFITETEMTKSQLTFHAHNVQRSANSSRSGAKSSGYGLPSLETFPKRQC